MQRKVHLESCTYGCLGELRSLIPEKCHIIVLTATATKSTKEQILQNLQN